VPVLPQSRIAAPLDRPGQPRSALDIGQLLPAAQQQAARDARAGVAANLERHESLVRLGREVSEGSILARRPFDQLAAARETTEAHRLIIDTTLEVRRRFQALQSRPDVPPQHLVGLAQQELDDIFSRTVAEAGRISPAAMEFVSQRLEGVRLNELSDLHRDALRRDVDIQRAGYMQQREFVEQEYFRTHDVGVRTQLLTDITQQLDRLTTTGVFSAVEAQREKANLGEFIVVETAVGLGAEDLEAGVTYVENSDLLPNKKRETIDAVISRAGQDRRVKALLNADRDEAMKDHRSLVRTSLEATALDPRTPTGDLAQLISGMVELERIGSLDGEGARSVQRIITARLLQAQQRAEALSDETRREARAEAKNRAAANFYRQFLSTDVPPGKAETFAAALAATGDANFGMNMSREAHNTRLANHFVHRQPYKDLIKSLEVQSPEGFNFDLFGVGSETRARVVRDAINLANQQITSIAGDEGVNVTNQQIVDIGRAVKENLNETLKREFELMTLAPTLGDMNTLLNMLSENPALQYDPLFQDDMMRAVLRETGMPANSSRREVLERLKEIVRENEKGKR
jgi:hypothetical protein